MAHTRRVTATIAAGASKSAPIGLSDLHIVGILVPVGWTAANLTFQGSVDGSDTVADVYDSSGAEVTVTAAASRYIALQPALLAGLRSIIIRSGTAAAPVSQAAARDIVLLLRDYA